MPNVLKEMWWGRYGKVPVPLDGLVTYNSLASIGETTFPLDASNQEDGFENGWRISGKSSLTSAVVDGVPCVSTTENVSGWVYREKCNFHKSLEGLTAFCIVRVSSFSAINSTNYMQMISFGVFSNNAGNTLSIGANYNSTAMNSWNHVKQKVEWSKSKNTTPSRNVWHSAVLVLDARNGSQYLYIDGARVLANSYAMGVGQVLMISTGQAFAAGVSVARIGLYARALTDAEITSLDGIIRPQ